MAGPILVGYGVYVGVAAVLAALGLGGCPAPSKEENDPSKPLDTPPDDQTRNPEPVRNCFQHDDYFRIKVQADNKCSYLRVEPLNLGRVESGQVSSPFEVTANWFLNERPASGVPQGATPRAQGQKLANLWFVRNSTSDGGVTHQNWGQIYPQQASTLGLMSYIEGTVDHSNPAVCRYDMTFKGTVENQGRRGAAQDQVCVAVYGNPAGIPDSGMPDAGTANDCLPTPDFSNETVLCFNAPLQAVFAGADQVVSLATPASAYINNSFTASSVSMTIIASGSPDAGVRDSGTPDAGTADSGRGGDAGVRDSGAADAGVSDSGSRDGGNG